MPMSKYFAHHCECSLAKQIGKSEYSGFSLSTFSYFTLALPLSLSAPLPASSSPLKRTLNSPLKWLLSFLSSIQAASEDSLMSIRIHEIGPFFSGPKAAAPPAIAQGRGYLFSKGNVLSIMEINNLPSSGINSLRIYRCSSSWKPQKFQFGQAKIYPVSSEKASLSSLQPCKATSDDLGRAVSGESILLNEESLERELDIAIEQENYAEAARIRDRIRVLHKDSEASVLAANARFYNAFRIGDLASMQNLWAKGDNVCCVHPGSSGISGYELVMRSWEYVWVDYEFPLEIELRDVQVHVRGEIGYVTCVELVKTKGSSWGRQFATNVFERVDGHWLISVHHASPVDL